MTGDCHARHIIDQVETSLRRLQTDYIDLYYAHDVDPHTRPEQTLAVYDDLIRQGKIRYVGLSNHPAWRVVRALWIADDHRLQAPVAAQGFSDAEVSLAREVGRLSREWGLNAYQVALAWLLSRPAVASVIIGPETVTELRENASAAEVQLAADQLEVLTALAIEPPAFHHRAGDGPLKPTGLDARV